MKKPQYLNIITVRKDEENSATSIIDGQQRITMLHIMFQLFYLDKDFKSSYLNKSEINLLDSICAAFNNFKVISSADEKVLELLANKNYDFSSLRKVMKKIPTTALLDVAKIYLLKYEALSDNDKETLFNNLRKSTWHVCEIDDKLSPYEVYINMNSKGTIMHWSDVVKQYWNAENNYKNYEEVKGIFVNCQKYFPDLLTYFISKKDTTDDYIAKAIDVYEKVYSDKILSSSDELFLLELAKIYKDVITSKVFNTFSDSNQREIVWKFLDICRSNNVDKNTLIDIFEKYFITTTLWLSICKEIKNNYTQKFDFNTHQKLSVNGKKSLYSELKNVETFTPDMLKNAFESFLQDNGFDNLPTMRSIIKNWLTTKPLYNEKVITNPQIKFILEKVNSMYESALFSNQEWTIEHIWPQHVKSSAAFTFKKWAKPSDESIQMLGNLTLLQKTPSAPSGKQNANSIASNKEPWVKFAAVYKSGLYITTSLTDTKKFEEDEIKARSAEFAEKFIDWLTF